MAEYVVRIGERIRARREELGLSQGDLARALPGKTDLNQVSRWERGIHKPAHDTLEAIARVLNVDIGYLLAADADKAETPDPFAAPTGDTVRLARMERKLDAIIASLGVDVTAAVAGDDLAEAFEAEAPPERVDAERPAPAEGRASKGRRRRAS